MDDILKQIDSLDDDDDYQKIIDLVEALDASDKTYDVQSELGRAYNNLANSVNNISEQALYINKAIEIFNSILDEERKDTKIHYRLAYSYWMIAKYFDALDQLDKSLSIDPEYENSTELYPMVINDLSSCNMRDKDNLSKRVDNFWKIFTEKEEVLRNAVKLNKNDGGVDLSNLVYELLKLVFEHSDFEIGFDTKLNKYEIILPINGNLFRIYTRQYLVSKMPDCIKENWVFTVGRRRIPNIDNISLKTDDANVKAGSIKIIPSICEDNKVDIKVYQIELSNLYQENENRAYQVLFPLLDMAIGEVITTRYIGNIDFLEADTNEEYITLSKLFDYITENLEDVTEGINSCSVYKAKAKEEGDFNYREDIFVGRTQCMEIISAYYNNDTSIIKELFEDTGAVLGYFYFDSDKYSNDEVLAVRDGIEESIAEKASDFGITIGAATGHSYSYIDFIAYDLDNFIQVSQNLLKTLECYDKGFSVFYPEAIKYSLSSMREES